MAKQLTQDKMVRYAVQLGWLNQMLSQKLLTDTEYRKVRTRLDKDYDISSTYNI